MSATVAILNDLAQPNSPPSRYEKLAAKLTDRYGHHVEFYDLRRLPKAFSEDLDLVVAGAPIFFAAGYYLSRAKHVPLINDFRDPYRLFFTRKTATNFFLAYRNRADAISTTMRCFIREYALDQAKTFYNPNAAPLEWTRLPDGKPEPQACYVGGLSNAHYHLDAMVQGFAEIAQDYEEHRLIIAGDGPLRPSLEDQVKRKGLTARVVFLGPIPPGEVPTLISSCQFGISLNPWLGQKHFEYAACGRACLGARERVENERLGWIICTSPKPSDVGQAMRQLFDDEGLRTRLGARGRELVMSRYNWDATARLWNDIICSLART